MCAEGISKWQQTDQDKTRHREEDGEQDQPKRQAEEQRQAADGVLEAALGLLQKKKKKRHLNSFWCLCLSLLCVAGSL